MCAIPGSSSCVCLRIVISSGESEAAIQDLTGRVYNFRRVTFPESEHLNWWKGESSFPLDQAIERAYQSGHWFYATW